MVSGIEVAYSERSSHIQLVPVRLAESGVNPTCRNYAELRYLSLQVGMSSPKSPTLQPLLPATTCTCVLSSVRSSPHLATFRRSRFGRNSETVFQWRCLRVPRYGSQFFISPSIISFLNYSIEFSKATTSLWSDHFARGPLRASHWIPSPSDSIFLSAANVERAMTILRLFIFRSTSETKKNSFVTVALDTSYTFLIHTCGFKNSPSVKAEHSAVVGRLIKVCGALP